MPADLRTDDFDYHLPDELIASRPLERRDASRMMVVNRAAGTIEHRTFADFPDLVGGSLLVLNNTRVARARFFSNDGRVEFLRLEALTPQCWRGLVRPGKRMREGACLEIGPARGTVKEVRPDGSRLVEFDQPVDDAAHGHLALPHYMKREDDAGDTERYQTVFAHPQLEQAIAAPTAGLHFTPEILAALPHTFVTLHVGIGTFQPVRAEFIKDHAMHVERYEITTEAAQQINGTSRLFAVGTTVTRVLEHQLLVHGSVRPGCGETGIFIHPGFTFRRVQSLLTNFHLPRSTLFMLVCALAGTDLMKQAYAEAVQQRYRFFSYGDCMAIL